MKALRWLDNNIEKVFITISYIIMAGIIFVEVVRRFFFGMQAPWSSQIPIYLFLMLAWIGTAYNAKVRSHLTFSEVRSRMPYTGKFICQIIDFLCWIVFASFVTYYSYEQLVIIMDNYAMVFGTDLYVWYFYVTTPVGWTLVIYRATQNLVSDIRCYKRGLPFGSKLESAEA